MHTTTAETEYRAQSAIPRIVNGRLVTVATVGLGLLLIVAGLALDVRAILSNPGWRNSTDFGGYQMAAYAFAAGGDPYIQRVQFFGVEMGYQYPPAFAVGLLVPLALVGPDVLRWIWCALVAASLGSALVLMFRGFGPPVAWRWTLLAIGALSMSRLVRSEIYHGQADLPLLLLIVVGLLCVRYGRPVIAGVALGACIVV